MLETVRCKLRGRLKVEELRQISPFVSGVRTHIVAGELTMLLNWWHQLQCCDGDTCYTIDHDQARDGGTL